MIFDENAQAIAKEKLLPKAVDTVHNRNLLAMRLLPKAQAWAGLKMEKTVIYQELGNGGSFSGLDRFNTNGGNTKVKFSFDVRGYEQPVVIPQMEADAVASSPQQSMDMIAGAIDEATNEMADNIGDLLYADGTGNSSKDFLGLAAIVDDGGEVVTLGGLSRSTYATIKALETDHNAAITLAAMATMYTNLASTGEMPTLIVTTPTVFNGLEALHQAAVVNNVNANDPMTRVVMTRNGVVPMGQGGLNGELGFSGLTFRGTPIFPDPKCTASTMWFINERHLGFYRLKSTKKGYSNVTVGGNANIEGVYTGNESAGFDWSGLMDPIDQYGSVGHIILMGNTISFDPRKHGVLNGVS